MAVLPDKLTKFFDNKPMTYSWDLITKNISKNEPISISQYPDYYDATVYNEDESFFKLNEQNFRVINKEKQRGGTILFHDINPLNKPEYFLFKLEHIMKLIIKKLKKIIIIIILD